LPYLCQNIHTDVGVSASGDIRLPGRLSNYFVWTSLGSVIATSNNVGQVLFGHVVFRITELKGKDPKGNDYDILVNDSACVLINGTQISWQFLCEDAAGAGSFNLINIGSDT
jgi:hypothetical protein